MDYKFIAKICTSTSSNIMLARSVDILNNSDCWLIKGYWWFFLAGFLIWHVHLQCTVHSRLCVFGIAVLDLPLIVLVMTLLIHKHACLSSQSESLLWLFNENRHLLHIIMSQRLVACTMCTSLTGSNLSQPQAYLSDTF